ncbi:hypothetical protein PVAP13_6NG180500 [Panicum virgatum]|uniref:FAM50A/XAP5 C-terminal domain-containing protein n=1 Tax=Panicum virgatum TaxID=38727 RepID=A0A8T0QXE7_PANVG|nr:hypothetical protein PVAP13_6NG180500 [Panicum virgatum]
MNLSQLQIYIYWDGTGSLSTGELSWYVKVAIGEFLRVVQQQLAPEFCEVRTTSVENLLYVKKILSLQSHSGKHGSKAIHGANINFVGFLRFKVLIFFIPLMNMLFLSLPICM